MLKLIHNRRIVQYILFLLGLGFAFYFAWSFWPFGEWVGKHFLQDAPGGPQVLGWISAAVMFGLILIIVVWKEYIKENANTYSDDSGDPSFRRAYKMFTWFVLGLELFSVLFRAILINFGSISFVILGVGILGIGVTYIVGKLLHAEVNRPPSVASKHLKDTAKRAVFEEGEKMVQQKKFSIPLLQRIGTGDTQPFQDVRDKQHGHQKREEAVKADREAKAEKTRKEDEEFYRKMTSPADFIEESPSSNGKRPANF